MYHTQSVALCQRENTGIVGAQLWYENLTIQHAGVAIGYRGVAGHCFAHMPYSAPGYEGRIQSVCDYSAVTAACMMMETALFDRVGGFDERYRVALNDVDLCLRVRALGYRVVYTPYAKLFHYESVSRGDDNAPENRARYETELSLFKETYGQMIKEGDPFYNPNLSRVWTDFSPVRPGEEKLYE